MESTGVYWKAVYYILECAFTVLLVNAQHMKNVPGRKTDVLDCSRQQHRGYGPAEPHRDHVDEEIT
jgi:transposase